MASWLDTEIHRKYHEVSDLFPLLEGPEFEALKADVAENGLLEAIWLHPDGSIIDGRNRHRACIETETEPRFRTWSGSGSLVSFVVSMNLHRRHLTSSQRAVIALDVLPMLEEEAAQRRQTTQGRPPKKLEEKIPQVIERELQARDKAAELFNTNPRYVQDAKKLQEEAPDLLEQVKAGEITIPQAKRDLTTRQRQEIPSMPTDKYRVVYADPPWEYGNKWSGGLEKFSERWTAAETHYPTMTIDELCEMGSAIKERIEHDAVLFLWVTSPLLRECFQVIESWGFKYKASFVWDKVRHNFGHYNSVRHEFLLVCTRGSCTPDIKQLFDSVQVIERTSTHSEKPEEFREIIDTIYPYGKRIELFARTSVDGWTAWGNEPGQYETC